jgi:hypothetical protein
MIEIIKICTLKYRGIFYFIFSFCVLFENAKQCYGSGPGSAKRSDPEPEVLDLDPEKNLSFTEITKKLAV